MTKILVVADEVDPGLGPERLRDIAPELVISCGDLPFDYLETLIDTCNVPLLYVPGNHDPGLRGWGRGMNLDPPYIHSSTSEPPGPRGAINIDGRIFRHKDLRIAGLGGSPRYRPGPNQYTARQMWMRVARLELSARLKLPGRLDLFVAHSPPRGVNDDDDPAHRGFRSFHRIISGLSPLFFLHGHVHPYGSQVEDVRLGATKVINTIPHRVIHITTPRVPELRP